MFRPALAAPSLAAPALAVLALAAALAGCSGYESAYERGVADYEPIYCYASLADPACYRKPDFRDARRLINYYGPAPRRYDRPPPAKPARLRPPPPLAAPPADERAPERPAPRTTPPPATERPLIDAT